MIAILERLVFLVLGEEKFVTWKTRKALKRMYSAMRHLEAVDAKEAWLIKNILSQSIHDLKKSCKTKKAQR